MKETEALGTRMEIRQYDAAESNNNFPAHASTTVSFDGFEN